MWYNTSVTKLLGIQYPIMQGPFGGNLSSVELLAAVSNAGGLGGYGAFSLSPQEIAVLDKKIKSATGKPYNLNLWVSDTDAPDTAITDEQYNEAVSLFEPWFEEAGIAIPEKPAPHPSRFENQVQVILDVRPAVFSFVFGIPADAILEQLRKHGIKTAGTATTLDEAIALENAGVDMIIASGFEAGGHRPSFLAPADQSLTGSFVLMQLVREHVKIPVVAAGGISNGRGIAAAITLGADAVQPGTAFLACEESGALPAHKQMLFSKAARQTTLTSAFTGRLGRGMANRITRHIAEQKSSLLPFPLQSSFISSLRRAAIEQEKWDMVFFWGGQIAPLLKHRNATTLMQSLIEETSAIYSRR